MLLQVTRPLYLDVTDFGSMRRLTGVQKLLLELANSEKAVELISFVDDEHFVVHEEVGLDERRDPELSSNRAWLRLIRWQRLGEIIKSGLSFLSPVYVGKLHSLYRWLYGLLFSPIRFSLESTGKPLRNVSEIDQLWVLYIPRDPTHISRLLFLAESRKVVLGMYIYDLIPLDQSSLLGVTTAPAEVKVFEHYLQLVSRVDKLRCLSEFTRQRLEMWWSESQPNVSVPDARVAYPPLDGYFRKMQRQANLTDEAVRTRKALGLRASQNLVLAVAPLNKRKNLLVVLRAIKKMLTESELVSLVVVAGVRSDNDPPTVREAQRLASRFPRNVRILPPVSEELYIRLLNACDTVAVPSLLEGYGMPCLEAAALGKNIVTSDAPVLKEIGSRFGASVASGVRPEDWMAFFRNPVRRQIRQPIPVNSNEDFINSLLT